MVIETISFDVVYNLKCN